jgi:hypothetical protein
MLQVFLIQLPITSRKVLERNPAWKVLFQNLPKHKLVTGSFQQVLWDGDEPAPVPAPNARLLDHNIHLDLWQQE